MFNPDLTAPVVQIAYVDVVAVLRAVNLLRCSRAFKIIESARVEDDRVLFYTSGVSEDLPGMTWHASVYISDRDAGATLNPWIARQYPHHTYIARLDWDAIDYELEVEDSERYDECESELVRLLRADLKAIQECVVRCRWTCVDGQWQLR